ncbi:hypothetical protein HPULCUR_000772 [Helicostylum pulchrum]|uniref:Uncharacterized protein n=1 Tax=Helicostylum pulchrum TaxID=562976 RepID=A0ABP9XM17_9FUNG
MDQNTLFDTRKDPTSEFGKEYKLYWDLRDSEEKKTTPSRASQQLQQMATDNAIGLAQIAWGSIQTQTQIALGTNRSQTSTSTKLLNDAESSENSTTISSSCSVDSRANDSNDDKVFEDYFHDINEAIDLDGVINWTVPAAREMAIDKFPASTILTLQDMCQFKEYEYTSECKSLVDRLSGEDKSVMG